MDLPKKGKYRHFKGGEYELMYVARHSESDEPVVVYRALYPCPDTPGGEGIWVRPLSMWGDVVERDGKRMKRFTYVDAAEETGFFDATVPPEAPADFYETDWDIPAPWEEVPPVRGKNTVTMVGRNEDKHSVLKRVFGYDAFRPGQEEIIDAILSGRDTLGVMPTGAGKSICYQVPALALSGCALVISPLISLMKDQVGQLVQSGVPAAFLNSSLTEKQMSLALEKAAKGQYKIIYIAPERLNTPRFLNLMRRIEVSMVAVDEAHCISQWGQDFRPSYLEIPDFLNALPKRPRLCAFTATATQRVRDDIVRLLGLQDPFERVTGFDRPNLYFKVLRPERKKETLLRLMDKYRGQSGIVYCATRKDVEATCELLLDLGISATRYHAGLSDGERRLNQEDFTYDRRQVMVATNAFGMGIDKSDVRFVIHYNMPGDLESYYQEAGRAGRDGDKAECILMYGKADEMTQRFFIDKMGEESELTPAQVREVRASARARLEKIINYCRTSDCLRATILAYFGEPAAEKCDFCGNCVEAAPRADVTDVARAVLECVRSLNGRYGAAMIGNVLRGSGDKRVREQGLDENLHYGRLKMLDKKVLDDLIAQLLDQGYLTTRGGQYPTLALGSMAQNALEGGEVVYARMQAQAAVKPRTGDADVPPEDRELYERLREVRRKLAAARSVPAYVIFNDSALRAICARRPTTPDEFLEVQGVGIAKMRAYGQDFIRAICRYQEGK